MSELKQAKDCPSCMAWAQYQGDLPEDWGECKCPKQRTITRADIPEELVAEIKSELIEDIRREQKDETV